VEPPCARWVGHVVERDPSLKTMHSSPVTPIKTVAMSKDAIVMWFDTTDSSIKPAR
jgi:hypothetical protein